MSHVKIEFVCKDAETAKELIDYGAELGLIPTDPVSNPSTNSEHNPEHWKQATQDALNNPGVTHGTAAQAPTDSPPDAHWPQENRTYNAQDLPEGFNPETDVDKKGNIYDPEIHAKTRSQTQKGVWKRRQGVTKEEHDAKLRQYQPPAPSPQSETQAPTGQTMPDGRPITGYDAYGNPIVPQQPNGGGAPTPQTETQAGTAPGVPGVPTGAPTGAPGLQQAVPLPSQRTYASFIDAMDALNELVTEKHKAGLVSTDPAAANSAMGIYNQAGVDMGMFNDVARQQNDLPGCLQEIYKALRAFEALR